MDFLRGQGRQNREDNQEICSIQNCLLGQEEMKKKIQDYVCTLILPCCSQTQQAYLVALALKWQDNLAVSNSTTSAYTCN